MRSYLSPNIERLMHDFHQIAPMIGGNDHLCCSPHNKYCISETCGISISPWVLGFWKLVFPRSRFWRPPTWYPITLCIEYLTSKWQGPLQCEKFSFIKWKKYLINQKERSKRLNREIRLKEYIKRNKKSDPSFKGKGLPLSI